jgi:YcaO-like protein with predicted kinase domain
MYGRDQLRRNLAKQICALPFSRLLEWGISRVGDVTGLDTIGIPIWTACRAPGECITISAGKGLTRIASMAGAILEGVELYAAEHPERHPEWAYCSYKTAVESFANVMPFGDFQLARDSPVNHNTPLAFEEMHDVFRDKPVVVPSDMIWLVARAKPPFQYFQSSSSGLAAGVNVQDAITMATYEIIERDGWAISEFVQEHTGQWRQCISLEGELHPDLQFCMDRLRAASVTPFLFDLTRDIKVPIFRCTILDDADTSPGCFSGFGCSLDPVTAARRAITEACQARAAYIAGARDDLFRRRFILMKNLDMSTLMDMYKSLPQKRNISSYGEVNCESIDQEWDALESAIKSAGLKEMYSKTIYTCDDPAFSIVKVIMPECECPLWEHYASGKRAVQALLEVR